MEVEGNTLDIPSLAVTAGAGTGTLNDTGSDTLNDSGSDTLMASLQAFHTSTMNHSPFSDTDSDTLMASVQAFHTVTISHNWTLELPVTLQGGGGQSILSSRITQTMECLLGYT